MKMTEKVLIEIEGESSGKNTIDKESCGGGYEWA